MRWDPALYLRHAGPRLRPGIDLISRVALDAPRRIVDLGCGTGDLTALLAERWPAARVVGLDASPEMLDLARARHPGIEWVRADLAGWRPPDPVDLVFSNAALHWLDGHERLLPRLLDALAPGGVLAVQMPRNFAAPSHRAIAEVAEAGPWRERLRPLVRVEPVWPPERYHRLLRPLSARLEVWETEYFHLLEGPDPVFEWVSGTALRPLMSALEEPERSAFGAAVRERLAIAYPPEPDGTTLFPFRRLFLVAAP
jgi:trans-aconitate 2-methyltransferase